MDTVIQLEYIIERERSRPVGRQHQPSDTTHVTTVSRVSDYLRRLLKLPRSSHESVRYA